eukprot:401268_1
MSQSFCHLVQPRKEKALVNMLSMWIQLQMLVNRFNGNIEQTLNQTIPIPINYLCFNYYFLEIKAKSGIITTKEKDIFAKLIQQNNISIEYNWNLIFRGSKHGFTFESFNNKCTNIKNVICIIYSEHGNVFGGFTKIGWPKLEDLPAVDDTKYSRDKNAFLYILRSKDNKYEPEIFGLSNRQTQTTVQSCFGWLSCFGNCGIDLALKTNCNKCVDSWVDWGRKGVSGCDFNTKTKHRLNGGICNFKVLEIELYQCNVG